MSKETVTAPRFDHAIKTLDNAINATTIARDVFRQDSGLRSEVRRVQQAVSLLTKSRRGIERLVGAFQTEPIS